MFNRVVLPVLSALTLAPMVAIAHPFLAMAQEAAPSVASVLPDNTAAVITINTSSRDWEAIKQYQLFPEIVSLAQIALAFAPPDFTIQPEWYQEIEEIKGWLGDRAAIALLSPSEAQNGKMDSNFVMVIPIKDRDRFTTYLARTRQTIPEKVTERQYKGVQIIEWQAPASELAPTEAPTPAEPADSPAPTAPPTKSLSRSPLGLLQRLKAAKLEPVSAPTGPLDKPVTEDPGNQIVVGILPDAVIISDRARPIEQLVDQQQADLTQSPLFRRTLEHPQYQRSLFSFYVNLAEAVKFTDFLPEEPTAEANGEANEEVNPDTPDMLPTRKDVEGNLKRLTDEYSAFDAVVWTQPEGIHSQSNTYYQKPRTPDLTTNVPDDTQIFSRLPAITYFAANGHNLKQQWQIIIEALSKDPQFKDVLREIRNGAQLYVGLDIDRDIVPWMDGNYAAFYFPSKRGFLSLVSPNFDLGMGFIVQTSNRAAAEIALERLNRSVRVKSNGELTVTTHSIQGNSVTSWAVKEGGTTQSILAYTWLDQNTLVLTTGLGSMTDLAPKPYLALKDNYTFRRATANFSRPNQGYAYVNVGASLAFIYGLLPYDDYPGVKEFKRVIGTIQSISATSLVTPEKEQVDSLIVLAPARKPVESAASR